MILELLTEWQDAAPRVVVYGWLLVREHKDMGGLRQGVIGDPNAFYNFVPATAVPLQAKAGHKAPKLGSISPATRPNSIR